MSMSISATRPENIREQDDLRHAHREHVNNYVCVEWLHYVPRDQTMIHARVLVLLELWQSSLPYVDHDCGSSPVHLVDLCLKSEQDEVFFLATSRLMKIRSVGKMVVLFVRAAKSPRAGFGFRVCRHDRGD